MNYIPFLYLYPINHTSSPSDLLTRSQISHPIIPLIAYTYSISALLIFVLCTSCSDYNVESIILTILDSLSFSSTTTSLKILHLAHNFYEVFASTNNFMAKIWLYREYFNDENEKRKETYISGNVCIEKYKHKWKCKNKQKIHYLNKCISRIKVKNNGSSNCLRKNTLSEF